MVEKRDVCHFGIKGINQYGKSENNQLRSAQVLVGYFSRTTFPLLIYPLRRTLKVTRSHCEHLMS